VQPQQQCAAACGSDLHHKQPLALQTFHASDLCCSTTPLTSMYVYANTEVTNNSSSDISASATFFTVNGSRCSGSSSGEGLRGLNIHSKLSAASAAPDLSTQSTAAANGHNHVLFGPEQGCTAEKSSCTTSEVLEAAQLLLLTKTAAGCCCCCPCSCAPRLLVVLLLLCATR
jgi:hypothetical protein